MSDYHVPTYELDAALSRAVAAEAKESELLSQIRGLETQVRIQAESIDYWVGAYGAAVEREGDAKAELERVKEIVCGLMEKMGAGE